MKLKPGDRLYKYLLKRSVGSGSFGQVWIAEDLALEKEVAIKIMADDMAPVANALNEARIGNRLDHKNVVKVHYADIVALDTGEKLVLIAMDYHSAGSIINSLNPARFLALPSALRCIVDVLRGLEYLHEKSLFHNDIKPSNILVGPNSEALLTDYGISCLSPGLAPIAAPNAYLLHRAPETAVHGSISVLTDIYQTGLTFFRLVNGIDLLREKIGQPGMAGSESKDSRHIISTSDFRPFVPAKVRRIILKATASSPAERYQSALEMRRAVEMLDFPGYWDADSTGSLFGVRGVYRYSFSSDRIPNGDVSCCAIKTNSKTGRSARVTAYSIAPKKKADARKTLKDFMLAVVAGNV